jgi:hypothetical protein
MRIALLRTPIADALDARGWPDIITLLQRA